MKPVKWILAASAAVLAAVSCGPRKDAPKVLVLYYSQTSNTKAVAEEIANRLGADIEEVKATVPYDGDFEATIQRSLREREEKTLPEIQPIKSDIASYDIIFVGSPIWFGTYAPPMASAFNQIDLSGKKLVPFCTFGSGGLTSSAKDLAEKFPDAEVLPGYGVRAARMDAMPGEIDQFLKANGWLEGEYVKLDEFPEAHEVSEEEAAIFDAAVAGYRMLNAKASKVASRSIPNGTEYLFTALSAPREPGAPLMEIQVYVNAEEGKDPVFTQVVR